MHEMSDWMPYERYVKVGWQPTQAPGDMQEAQQQKAQQFWQAMTPDRNERYQLALQIVREEGVPLPQALDIASERLLKTSATPFPRPKPGKQPKSKFHTTLDQHQRGKLVHNLKWGFPPKRSAIDPDFLAQHIARHGPYLYHGTDNDAAKVILKEGLYPHDHVSEDDPNAEVHCPECREGWYHDDPDLIHEPSGAMICPRGHELDDADPPSRSSWRGQFLEPRSGHVYLGTHKYASNYGNGQLLKVDLRKLDPNLINADEDHFNDLGDAISPDHKAYLKSLHEFDPPPEPYDWHSGNETLGQWADRAIGRDPEATTHSLNSGSVAYEGHVPPEAVSLWTSADGIGGPQKTAPYHTADQYLQANMEPQEYHRFAPDFHDRAAQIKGDKNTWADAYRAAVGPYSGGLANGLEQHMINAFPEEHAGWDLSQDPGAPQQIAASRDIISVRQGLLPGDQNEDDALAPNKPTDDKIASLWNESRQAKTDANHFEARMFHHSEKGLVRGIKTPFMLHDKPHPDLVSHEYSVTLRRPFHVFVPFMQAHLDAAKKLGADGVVSHTDGMHAMVLDPGAVVPGHDHEFPYA